MRFQLLPQPFRFFVGQVLHDGAHVFPTQPARERRLRQIALFADPFADTLLKRYMTATLASSPLQMRRVKVRPLQLRFVKVRSLQVRPMKVRSLQLRPVKVRSL